MTAPTDPIVFAPLRIEAMAVRHGPLRALVQRSGYGIRRATRSARDLSARRPATVTVAGFAGGLGTDTRPGDLVVATEVRDSTGTIPCPAAPVLAGELRRAGLRVHEGPVLTVDRVVRDRQRTALAATGAIACDMESAPLVRAAGTSPVAVVRAVVDTPGHHWAHLDTPRAVWSALKSLRAAVPVLAAWSRAAAPRTALLAEPHSLCAGVERAIDVVARALDRYEAPIYVRKQIAHNSHVVRELERRGAVFVDELDEVPDGATLIYSAHGVAPAVRRAAAKRGLRVIDATCPLVTATHSEACRFASRGDIIALIGQAGHEEIDGILGQAPDHAVLVESVEDVAALPADRPISYLTQTTLVADEAERITEALLEKFPDAEGPAPEHRCHAMTNRQDALRAVARDADVVLVAGSANSSNAQRLVELADRGGTPAHLIDGAGDIHLDWLADAGVVGVTAGASTPPDVVDSVVDALRGLGPVEVAERRVATESVRFTLPKEVRSS